jgi:uncharacterized protein YjlB
MDAQSIAAPLQHVNISRYTIRENGNFPNNPRLPLLIFSAAIKGLQRSNIEGLLEQNGWVDPWHDGILDYHHYHSTAHEVLVVTTGAARLQFGGPDGQTHAVSPGDVIVIPAGVAHRCLEHDEDFKVVGAYPDGQKYDMMEGKDGEMPEAEKRIKNVPLPLTDPIFGINGPLISNWSGSTTK